MTPHRELFYCYDSLATVGLCNTVFEFPCTLYLPCSSNYYCV